MIFDEFHERGLETDLCARPDARCARRAAPGPARAGDVGDARCRRGRGIARRRAGRAQPGPQLPGRDPPSRPAGAGRASRAQRRGGGARRPRRGDRQRPRLPARDRRDPPRGGGAGPRHAAARRHGRGALRRPAARAAGCGDPAGTRSPAQDRAGDLDRRDQPHHRGHPHRRRCRPVAACRASTPTPAWAGWRRCARAAPRPSSAPAAPAAWNPASAIGSGASPSIARCRPSRCPRSARPTSPAWRWSSRAGACARWPRCAGSTRRRRARCSRHARRCAASAPSTRPIASRRMARRWPSSACTRGSRTCSSPATGAGWAHWPARSRA